MRPFIDELANTDEIFKVSHNKWKEIGDMKNVLHQPYILTMALQNKDYTFSEFYGDWLKAKMNLQKMNHPLAEGIVTHMKEREITLMNCNVMLGSVYLDPRYNRLLNETQTKVAENYLCELWNRLIELCPLETDSNDTNSNEVDDFAEFIANATQKDDDTTQSITIAQKIKRFLNRPTINYKCNIFEYWKSIKMEEPELFRLRVVLLSAAVTQVDVERSFSSLKFIFNNFRAKLSTEMLSILLVLRSNHDLFPKNYEIYIDSILGQL